MKIDYAARVEIGKRPTNDDRILIDGNIIGTNSLIGSIDVPSIVAVCDGCGGYLGGSIAAQTVLEILLSEDSVNLSNPSYLAKVLDNCQHFIIEKKIEMPNYSEMCTTVAGCVFCSDSILFFHSGDSRVYRHDQWCIARMTKDHSLVQDMIDNGELSSEEALLHPQRNVITRCIGIEGLPAEIYISHAVISPGESYLICSDGLWESVSELQIKEVLDSKRPLQQKVDDLVQIALEQGADDNISICICSRNGSLNVQEEKPFILD